MKKYKNKLIQLQILKLYYKKKSSNFKTSLKQIEIHLNKISNIIYKYHITNKKILFVGFPENFQETLQKTKHLLIPEFVWFNGMLTNRTIDLSNINNLTKKQRRVPMSIHQLLLRLKKKLDLVIVYNLDNKSTVVKESYVSRIPVITISQNLNLNLNVTYKAPGNYNFVNEKKINNNIFYSMINTTLNRAIAIKRIKSLRFRSITQDFYQKRNKQNIFMKRQQITKKTKSLQRSKNYYKKTKK